MQAVEEHGHVGDIVGIESRHFGALDLHSFLHGREVVQEGGSEFRKCGRQRTFCSQVRPDTTGLGRECMTANAAFLLE